MYAKLKIYFSILILNLKKIYNKIVLYWQSQHTNNINNLTRFYLKMPHQFIQSLFRIVINEIDFYTLNKINKQLNKLA